MKRTLAYLILFTLVGAWAQAQETSVKVTPSDQIIYPDASQILNKTETKALPSAKPLMAATPVLAAPTSGSKPLPPASTPPIPGAPGWYLRWTVTGDEAEVKAWAQALGPVQMAPSGPNLWEVLRGPVTAADAKAALEGQAGRAQLVRK